MSEKNNCFKEAVCIEVQRIFDSCSDRDGIFDLPVTLNCDSPPITDDMNVVRVRSVEVDVTCIAIDTVMFKAGYFTVDITYRFKIVAEAFTSNLCQAGTLLCGTAVWNKRVILYGGESNARIFTSEQDFKHKDMKEHLGSCCCSCSCAEVTLPKATVRVVDPIALDAKIICIPPHHSGFNDCMPCCCNIPTLVVSLGLFSMVQLSRPVSVIVPVYDYCVPGKECITVSASSETPSEIFERLDFPINQFMPQPTADLSGNLKSDKDLFSDEHKND